MCNVDAAKYAGGVLKELISERYATQEEFAYDFGAESRMVSRYVNEGVTKVELIQELAEFFHMDMKAFFPGS